MSDALISCIVPVYNGARFLGEALDSILAQRYRPVEVIVVDDGSTDASGRVARGYGERVRYVHQPKSGPASARNRGVAEARGAFLAFLDADDLWHPDKLALQHQRLCEHGTPALCLTRFQNFWIPELAAEAERYRNDPVSGPCSAWHIGTLLATRELLADLGPFPAAARGFENMLWFLQAAQRGTAVLQLPDVLMQRRIHSQHETQRVWAEARDAWVPVVKAWRDLCAQRAGRGAPNYRDP